MNLLSYLLPLHVSNQEIVIRCNVESIGNCIQKLENSYVGYATVRENKRPTPN